MRSIASFLRIEQSPESVQLATNQKQQIGSCQWLTDSHSFQEWVTDSAGIGGDLDTDAIALESHKAMILWLNGRPGTGKSVATSHVVRYLQSCNLDCSFYFFRHEDMPNATAAAMLRSLAFQMAESNFKIRRIIMSMAEDGFRMNLEDHHMIWASIFVDQIFKAEQARPHYWVIDALDECMSKSIPALVSMLASLSSRNPLRIFVSSRPGGQLERLLLQEDTRISQIHTGEQGSMDDIKLYLQSRCYPATNDDASQDLVGEMVSKSNGNFLWAALTVANLEDAYSIEDKQAVLRQIPPEMDEFYSRIASSIVESASSELAKCILAWVLCSARPLSFDELIEAVKLDINRTLTASASQIETLTGHLVFVDAQNYVHITHQTAQAFLTRQKDGLWIDQAKAHSRLAEICLQLLCGSSFSPPRIRRNSVKSKATVLPPLSNYALLHYSFHLVNCSPTAGNPHILATKFFTTNVLTWIEKMADSGSLWTLQLAANRLHTYLGRRAEYQSPIDKDTQVLTPWASDLHHIFAAFNSHLVSSPSSIHWLVPHLCPSSSIIRQRFAKPARGHRITGFTETDWSDRLACYLHHEEATAIALSNRYLAVGLAGGDIKLYHLAGSLTFNSVGTLKHEKKVRHLAFSRSSLLLVSCSPRRLILWNIHETEPFRLWSVNIGFIPSTVAFSPEEKSVVLTDYQNSAIVAFEVSNGSISSSTLLHAGSESDSSDEDSGNLPKWTPASRIRLDINQKVAAIAYRNASVSIWDLEEVEKIGDFEKEGFENIYVTPPTLDMIFNPIPDLELLALTYEDGDIITCNPWTLDQECKQHFDMPISTLAATSDGRILAGAAENGEIYILIFDTLQLLYHIKNLDGQLRIHDIVFSNDNLRFYDIRGQCCNVWEPLVLLPKNGLDESSFESQNEELSLTNIPSSRAHEFQWGEIITIIEADLESNRLFVGRQGGSIDIFTFDTTVWLHKLQLHDTFSDIKQLVWNGRKSILVSLDNTNRYLVTKFTESIRDIPIQVERLLDRRESASIQQLIIDDQGQYLLVHTGLRTETIDLNGNLMGEQLWSADTWWMSHPSNSSLIMAIHHNEAYSLQWPTLKRVDSINNCPGPDVFNHMESTNYRWIGGPASSFLVQASKEPQQQMTSLAVLDTSKAVSEITQLSIKNLKINWLGLQSILGCIRSNLYFLNTSGWVCSINLKNSKDTTHYIRHFYIPFTWQTGTENIVKIISKTSVAFGRGEQLVVFHGFLDFEETMTFGV